MLEILKMSTSDFFFLMYKLWWGVNDYKKKQINGTRRLHLYGDHKEHDHFIGQT